MKNFMERDKNTQILKLLEKLKEKPKVLMGIAQHKFIDLKITI